VPLGSVAQSAIPSQHQQEESITPMILFFKLLLTVNAPNILCLSEIVF
jgi:hypothetical protein